MGDMLTRNTTGYVQRVSTTTNATSLVGIAMSASPTTDPTATVIKVYQVGFGTVFQMDLASDAQNAAWKYGQQFTLYTGQPQQLNDYGTAGVSPNSSATAVVAVGAEYLAASGSTMNVTFMQSQWNKLIVVS